MVLTLQGTTGRKVYSKKNGRVIVYGENAAAKDAQTGYEKKQGRALLNASIHFLPVTGIAS
jgi:hypothetical protein